MCHFKTWFHDEKGYVIQCLQCNKVQIGYGILALNFKTEDFERFRKQIFDYYVAAFPGYSENVKSMMLPTPCEGMNLLFSYKELKELHQMLEFTDNEMKAEGLLECFKQFNK